MNSKMVKRLVVCLLLLGIASSNGCMFQIAPLVKIPFSDSGYESNQVAIAVGADGKMHVARTECPTGTTTGCRLVYTQVKGGAATNIMVTNLLSHQTNISDPDIAVTYSNAVYYVFRIHYDDGKVYDYYKKYTNTPDPSMWRVDDSYESLGPPKVAAAQNANAVGIVYQTPDGGNIRLRYVMLLGATNKGTVETLGSNQPIKPLRIAVSDADRMYVLWGRENVFNSMRLASNYNGVNEMTIEVGSTWQTRFSNLEMPLEFNQSETWIYDAILYPAIDSVSSDAIHIDRWASNDFSTVESATANLDPTKVWRIQQPICMQVDQDKVYLAIVASNSDVTTPELYAYDYTFGSGVDHMTRITYNSENEGPPECAYYDDGDDAGFVISWRRVELGSYPTTYVWDAVQNIRTVPLVSTDGREGFDMKGNGRFVGGIANVLTSGKITPWVGYNAELMYLPIVRK
jgi:hypothetical protein